MLLLAIQPKKKISLISPSLSRQGNSGSLLYLWLTVQGLKGQGLCVGKMTSNICGIFFHLLNSLTYFRIISRPCVPLWEALFSNFRGDENFETFFFLLTQDSENGQTDLSVYKFRILIGIRIKTDLFLGSLLYLLFQAYPLEWIFSAGCSSITLSCVYMSLPMIRGLCWWHLHYSRLLNSATSLISGCLLDEGGSRSCVFQVIF